MAQLPVKGRQFFRRKSKGCSAQVFFETAARWEWAQRLNKELGLRGPVTLY